MSAKHKARPKPTSPYSGVRHLGKCSWCGKLRFPSRQVAKRAARQAMQHGVQVTRVYECHGFWHWTSQDTAATEKYRKAG